MGRRLLGVSGEKPKGFMTLGHDSIIAESLSKLRHHGITSVYIGTGYQQSYYECLAQQFLDVQCIYNEAFATTGSMATLRLLQDYIKSDFLLLESDIIYERRALRRIIDAPFNDAILTSDVTSYGDEVFVSSSQNGLLVGMSKNADAIENPDSIFVGISKLSIKTLNCMFDFFDAKQNPALNYEDAMIGVSKKCAINVCNAGSLHWCEIDTPEHLNIARQSVYPAIRRNDDYPLVTRNILLNPGPATTTDTVKYAQVIPDICPREIEFGYILQEVSERITDLVANTEEYVSVLFGGSGTAVIESILSSVIGPNDHLCIVNNGNYGVRMHEIAQIYQLSVVEYVSDPYRAVDVKQLVNFISGSQKNVTHLAVVHHETTTGVLNNLDDISKLCARRNIVLIVDAISSFGAIPINMQQQCIHYLAATANKNLQGIPGVSFVIAARTMLESTKEITPRNLYLNLYNQYNYQETNSQTRFTPPVQAIYALRQALIETNCEGIEARYTRYANCWSVLIDGLKRLRLELLVPIEFQSKLLTTIKEPSHSDYNFKEMHDFLIRQGFTIYPGSLSGCNTFRIANIGAIVPDDIKRFITALTTYFLYKGIIA